MPLSDTAIKNAKATAGKAYKLTDNNGMYVYVHHNGSKYFRLDYRFEGKRKTLALGVYPATTLPKAREKTLAAKQHIADGIDPGENKKAVRESRLTSLANSFEVIAREWGLKKIDDWENKNNRSKRMLERNIFPWLGNKPITDILPKDILACLMRLEERGTLPPAKGGHFASMTDPKQIAPLLRAIDEYTGSPIVKSALQLAPLVFVRPGELRHAEWEHIDLEAKEWRYLVTKTQTQHRTLIKAIP
jgi:Arm DNA-binding domain